MKVEVVVVDVLHPLRPKRSVSQTQEGTFVIVTLSDGSKFWLREDAKNIPGQHLFVTGDARDIFVIHPVAPNSLYITNRR